MSKQVKSNSELLVKLEESNLEIWRVPLMDIIEQDKNAQVMPPEMFDRLTSTIQRDKRVESFPFTVKREINGVMKFELISVHHRVRAVRAAGLKEIIVIADTRDLERSAVVAKQIAHNAINGKSDEEMLKEMFEEITSVDDLFEAYISQKDLELYIPEAAPPPDQIAINYDWKMMSFLFLSFQLEDLEELIERMTGAEDFVGIIPIEVYERFVKEIDGVVEIENIKSMGAIINRMIEVTNLYFGFKKDEEVAEIPIVKIFGKGSIPKEDAKTLNDALDIMIEKKIIAPDNKIGALMQWVKK